MPTKIADKNEEFRLQREKLENFSRDFKIKLKVLLSEMEGDLLVLKYRELPKNLWKIFIKLWNDLVKLSGQVDSSNPYPAAQQFVNYVKQRPQRAVIDNLDYLIQHHMQQTKVDFKEGPMLVQAQAKSLKLLKALADQTDKYLQDNPLIDVPGKMPEEDVKLKSEREEYKPSSREGDVTMVPPVRA